MPGKQLKHFKSLNPDRGRERERESQIEGDDGEAGGGGGAQGESLSQWEMTNAICPECSACVNPRWVPAGPHPTLRPLHNKPQLPLPRLPPGRVNDPQRDDGEEELENTKRFLIIL